MVTKGWDDIVDDDPLKQMMAETLTRVHRSNPALPGASGMYLDTN